MRTITIVNQSTVVTPDDFVLAVSAIQKQISRDFEPAWGIGAVLAVSVDDVATERIYLLDNSDQADALGYHEEIGDVPVGFVFAKTDLDAGQSWTATLSHEVLEQLADPLINLGALGAYGMDSAGNPVPAWFTLEVCDACENDECQIDGVTVSNFLLPAWFEQEDPAEVPPGPFDFMGTLSAPFSMSPGGYVSYQTTVGVWQQAFGAKPLANQMTPNRHSRRARRIAR